MRRSTNIHTLIGACGFSVVFMHAPASLWAQDTQASTEQAAAPDALEEVEVWGIRQRLPDLSTTASVGSRLNLTALEIPASIEILSGDTVRLRGDMSLVDAVTRATGVSSTANPGNGGTALAARGFSGHGSVMQLVDGMRLYVGAGTVTFPFDPWMAERIEVLRGPASVLYGEGAIGGAINVVSRKPNTQRQEMEAQVGLGSDDTVRAAFGAGGPLSSMWAYRFDVSHGQSDGWVDRGESDNLAVSASLRLELSPDLAFTLSNDYGDQEPMQYFGTPLVDGVLDGRTRNLNYNVADSELRYRDNWTRLEAQWNPSSDLSVRNNLYRLETERTWRNVESYFWNPDAAMVDRFDYIAIRHDETQIGNRADVTLHQSLLGRRNAVVLGFDLNQVSFQHTNNSPYGGESTVDPWRPDAGAFIDLAGTLPRYKTFTRQYSLFAEDRLALSEQWSLVGGLRLDRAQVRRDDLIVDTTLFEETLDSVGGRFGVVYAHSSALSLYAQYARGTDPLGGLITLSVAQKDLDLTTGDQVEVGLKQAFADGQGEWTLALYDITKKKLLTRDPANPALTQQIGERSARGVEASLTFQPAAAWLIEANASVLKAQFDDFTESVGGALISRNGNVPPGVPEQLANIWASWQFAPSWHARAGLRYVGETYSDNANAFRVPDYTVMDASVGWAFSKSVLLSLRGYNLLDEEYATSTYNDEQWLLGRPRSLELALNVSF